MHFKISLKFKKYKNDYYNLITALSCQTHWNWLGASTTIDKWCIQRGRVMANTVMLTLYFFTCCLAGSFNKSGYSLHLATEIPLTSCLFVCLFIKAFSANSLPRENPRRAAVFAMLELPYYHTRTLAILMLSQMMTEPLCPVCSHMICCWTSRLFVFTITGT